MDKTVLDKFLNEMGELLKTTKDFTVDQAPQVAKEILAYSLVYSIFWVLSGFVLLFLCYKFFKFAQKLCERDDDYAPIFVFVVLFFVISSLWTAVGMEHILKLYFAPRLFLIEYIGHLVSH